MKSLRNQLGSILRTSVLAAGVTAFGASAGLAGTIGTEGSMNLTRVGGYYLGSGGEFSLGNFTGANGDAALGTSHYSPLASGVSGLGSIQSFCLELSENAAGINHYVANSLAWKGSESAGDPLTNGVAWLYNQFARGVLTSYFYDGTNNGGNVYASRAAAARDLQRAIWWLAGEAVSDQSANRFVLLAVGAEGAGARLDAPAGYLGVYALNNFNTAANRDSFANGTGGNYGRNQDMLYWDGTGGTDVPDGGYTLVLLGLALSGLGGLAKLKRLG